jgi:hypothetical protein
VIGWEFARVSWFVHVTGYQVEDLSSILDKARAAGVRVLSAPYRSQTRTTAIVEFPGGYVAEVHSVALR